MLTVAGDLLRPRRPHLRDRQDLTNLGHPSADDEPRRIAVADKEPEPLRRLPSSPATLLDLSPRLRTWITSNSCKTKADSSQTFPESRSPFSSNQLL
ncbi:hypothetical protein GUJ93_ZPchr0001g29251 [Zizania palustris]|uniref:Uncharacterized protein n=1 Tax=Zizania palustris TaxID=103762 RepID=A0A8J5SB16_ZIZPA|nr:hypothetical protein GUJ93_ZPchr0001g29251 [Zizania palustris]